VNKHDWLSSTGTALHELPRKDGLPLDGVTLKEFQAQ